MRGVYAGNAQFVPAASAGGGVGKRWMAGVHEDSSGDGAGRWAEDDLHTFKIQVRSKQIILRFGAAVNRESSRFCAGAENPLNQQAGLPAGPRLRYNVRVWSSSPVYLGPPLLSEVLS